jgi:oligopeptide transport system substrate-binding protein
MTTQEVHRCSDASSISTTPASGHKAIAEAFSRNSLLSRHHDDAQEPGLGDLRCHRKAGNYTFARNGWLCDYNDPISMLDMWISTSGNDDVQLGKGDNATYAGYEVDMMAMARSLLRRKA